MKRIILCTILALSNLAIAKDYFVSPSGNDKNQGTINSPFKTIQKASELMQAGDTCFIKSGIYNETISPLNSGREGSPITYRAFEQDNVVIDATKVLNGWRKHSENIYKVKVDLKLGVEHNNLYHEGKVLDIARWPNNEDDDRFTFDGFKIKGGTASSIKKDGFPEVNYKDGYFCYLGSHSGTSWTRKINEDDGDNIHFNAVDIKKWPFVSHNPSQHKKGQLYLFGKLELLDHPKEWYYSEDEKTVYAIFPEYKAPKPNSVRYAQNMYTADVKKNFIDIDGLKFFGGSVRISGNNCTLRNSILRNCSQSLDDLDNQNATNGNASVILTGSDIKIDSNIIEYGSSHGIAILTAYKGGKNYHINNNIIRYFNTIGIHSAPIRSVCPNTIITYNTIYTCGRDGIQNAGQYSEIAYNDISDCLRINNDGGVFYTVGNQDLKHTKIHHNFFHDSKGPEYADGRCAGIYLDNNSKGYDVYNNVVSNITWAALMFNWNNVDLKFYNNSLWNVGASTGRWANGHEMENIILINNYASKISQEKDVEWIGTEIKTNVIDENSPFVSVEENDFRLREDAKNLINKGTKIKGFSKDYKGKAPDIGAYEFGEEKRKVGSSLNPEIQ